MFEKKFSLYFFRKNIFFLFLLILISSCATPKKEKKQELQIGKKHTVIDATRFSDEANIRIRASISFRFPDMSNSANAVIEMAGRDSVLITVTGPFGISVGRLYANPSEFIMNNNLQNTTFTGVPTQENIMQIANIPLSFNDLMSIFRTSTPQNPNNYIFNNELLLFELAEFTGGLGQFQELVFTNSNNDITRIERKNISGQTLMLANFTDHFTVGKYRFARNLNLNFPTLNGTVGIRISDISLLSQPTSPMRFSKPRSFREYRFE